MQNHSFPPAGFEKFEDFFDVGEFKIEGSINEFELFNAAGD